MTEPAAPVCYRHPDRLTRLSCTECGRPICVECSIDAAVGQKCPECSKTHGRHRVIDARRTTGTQAGFTGAPVTQAIVYLTVAIHLIRFVSDNADIELFQRLALAAGNVDQGELWRLVSHALLHSTGNLLHIFFNMYILYLLGPRLESQVGTPAFAAMYLACAGAGGAAYYVMTGPGAPGAVGASGAIFGLFGAWLFVYWKIRHTPAGRGAFNQFGALILINLALPFFIPNIAWQAHLGGLAAGLAIAWLWSKLAVGKPNAVVIRTVIAAVFVVASVIVVLAV